MRHGPGHPKPPPHTLKKGASQLVPLPPFVGRVVIFDTALHVLQLIQHGKHVNEFPQRQEIGLGDKILPSLRMAQALHLAAEPLDGLTLEDNGRRKYLTGVLSGLSRNV